MIFSSGAMLVEKSINNWSKKKKFNKKTMFLIYNLKLLPFLKENDAINFYQKLKIDSDEKFEEFFEHFESNWLAIEENKKSKFEFKFWSYSKYLNKTNKKGKNLKDHDRLKDKVFYSNNCVESINHLINSYIDVNNKIGIARFEIILKTLFIRLNTKLN